MHGFVHTGDSETLFVVLHTAESGQVWSELWLIFTLFPFLGGMFLIPYHHQFGLLDSGYFLSIILMLSSFKHSIGYLEEDTFFPSEGLNLWLSSLFRFLVCFSYIFSVLSCLTTNGYIVWSNLYRELISQLVFFLVGLLLPLALGRFTVWDIDISFSGVTLNAVHIYFSSKPVFWLLTLFKISCEWF